MDDFRYDRLYNGGSRWPFPLAHRFRKHKFAVYPGTRIYYTHESRRGWFTMGRQIADRLYRWRRYDGGGGVCERTSVKSGASIMQRGGSPETHPRHGRGAAPVHGVEIN